MNDKKLIGNLKLLRNLKLRQADSLMLYDRIFSQIQEEHPDRRNLWADLTAPFRTVAIRPIFTISAALILLLVILFVSVSGNPRRGIESVLFQTEIVLAPDKYQKAELALNFSRQKLNDLKSSQGKDTGKKIEDLMNSTSRTNTYLAGLNLMGEKGKYTNAQCLSIYKFYDSYLDDLKNTLTASAPYLTKSTDRNNTLLLQKRISEYEKQAESRLKLY